MRKFLYCKEAFAERDVWQRDCWISIVTPDEDDVRYLTGDLLIPRAFLSDINDVDERPRMETEDGWTLMILRIPYRDVNNDIPYITVPLGMIMKDHYFVTVCHYETDMLPDFLLYVRRKGIEVNGNWDLLFRLFLSSSVWYLKYRRQSLRIIRDCIDFGSFFCSYFLGVPEKKLALTYLNKNGINFKVAALSKK